MICPLPAGGVAAPVGTVGWLAGACGAVGCTPASVVPVGANLNKPTRPCPHASQRIGMVGRRSW